MLAQVVLQNPVGGACIGPDVAEWDAGRRLSALPMPGVRMTFARGEEIFGDGEPADHVYRVISGAVRTYRMLSDGRRLISDFHLVGDFFGLEMGQEHRIGAEAIGDTEVLAVRRSTLNRRAAEDCDLSSQVWRLTADSLERTREHALLLGRQGACERVCAFLLDLADRLDQPADLTLPMSRQDMADYLGLTIETVSRTLTQLQAWNWIALPAVRRIVFTDRAAMHRLCC